MQPSWSTSWPAPAAAHRPMARRSGRQPSAVDAARPLRLRDGLFELADGEWRLTRRGLVGLVAGAAAGLALGAYSLTRPADADPEPPPAPAPDR